MCSPSSQLQSVFFHVNEIVGQLPESIGECPKIQVLSLAFNYITGSIPKGIGNLTMMQNLYLGYNKLTGIIPEQIASVGNLSTSIQNFGADKCDFRGRIPEAFGNLENLYLLTLDENELTGAIPNTLGNLKKLQGLTLSGNMISGSIPSSLCSLQNLNRMWLQQNQISGSLPECIGNMSSMREIYLGINRLSSVIPTNLWNLNDLVILDLSSNLLTGFLPSDIRNLKVAATLDLSENQLTGIIPSSIGGLENVANLSLARNRFQGSIPESMGKLLSLEMLDLSHNNLSGGIPLSLEGIRFRKYFDVSFNELSGPIPTGGPFKSLSSQFFMSNGGLCGDPKYGVPQCHEISTVAESKRKEVILRVVHIFLGISVLVFAIISSYILARHCKKNKVEILTDSSINTAPSRVPYHELVKATEGYNDSRLLGTGSYGSVYRGSLQNGEVVAVKVFNLQSEGGFNSFDTECEVLRRLRHRNLCKVIGSCSNEDFKALVLEYMPNGSLEKWLYLEHRFLNIMQRLNIMIDVACALEYLHCDYSIPIVHCDLKPNNVLLDNSMVAHLSDFGLAKLLNDGVSITLTRTLATLGYIAPEYGSEGLVSIRCDAYSYGIMLMEVFTRMKPNDTKFTGNLSLRRLVSESVPDAIMQVIDLELLRADEKHFSEKLECLVSIMKIALQCSIENPNERVIRMKSVVIALKKILSQLQRFVPLAGYA